jgi:hypothetical protein
MATSISYERRSKCRSKQLGRHYARRLCLRGDNRIPNPVNNQLQWSHKSRRMPNKRMYHGVGS